MPPLPNILHKEQEIFYMAELFEKSDRRTHYCGDVTEEFEGKQVCVCGWVQKRRDLGSLIFIDLRDRKGVVQLSFDDTTDREVFEKALSCRSEYVLSAKGTVRRRSSVNNNIKTGQVEIYVTSMKILSVAETTPFEITDNTTAKEELRLKYRYLDLRRPVLQNNILIRHRIAQIARSYFYENGFLEIETPMMIKPTPEGARDYLVPSRIHHGKTYALPQSPQIYKQLLMIAGCDRYIQLARCFRDEDLRADRQPEFTQIDLEMSFTDEDEIMTIIEGFFSRLFSKVLEHSVSLPIKRMTFTDAMNLYGTDKPDLRYGMEIINISDTVKACGFSVFTDAVASGGSVRAVVAPDSAGVYTRKEIDKLTETVRGIGAKGMAYIRWFEDAPSCSFAKFLNEGELDAIIAALGMKKGDCAFIIADKDKVTLPVLGAVRIAAAKKLDMIKPGYEFVWITEMPFFEYDEESGTWVAMHHPFTMPLDECLQYIDTDPGRVRAKCYDLVLNGIELLSGSIRITDNTLQQKMFERLGLTQEEIDAKFGFLVDGYKYGAPPHGGAGIGLDRIAMLMCGADSLRDVVPFPKVQNASELMSACPAAPEPQALTDLAIRFVEEE